MEKQLIFFSIYRKHIKDQNEQFTKQAAALEFVLLMQ